MRENHLKNLVDPVTGKSVKLDIVLDKKGDHVMAGILKSERDWYPIINGVPRMMVEELKAESLKNHIDFYEKYKKKLAKNIAGEWEKIIKEIPDLDKFLKHQKKTAESFAYEWKKIYRENNFEKNNFLHFLSPFVKDKDIKGKKTLDIGCGSGRFTKWAALLDAEIAYGTDLGESVEVAFEMTKDIKNVCIIQADIYNMPFNDSIDIAYSIGVLHHLPDPQGGFLSLKKVLNKTGQMLIWVYNRRNNNRALYFYEPLRTLVRKVPRPLLLKMCYLPASVVHMFNFVTVGLNKVGAKKIAKKVPFFYYANFPFNMKLNDAFDVLATPKSNYYFSEEIREWFKKGKYKEINSFEHVESGITCVGKN